MIPSKTVQPTPSSASNEANCTETHGQIETRVIPSNQYKPGSVQIYLPPCYASGSARRYPVLYLLHGSNTDNTQWIQLGVPGTTDRLIQSGQVPAFLVVMPREEFYLQDPNESVYGNWIIHILVPWVDQNYATCATQACRAIGGLSRGGSWAFRIGLADWQDFSAIGLDSSVPFTGDLASSRATFNQIPAAQQPRFYIDIGKDDGSVEQALAVVEALTRLRAIHEWHLSNGAHNRVYWRAHVEDYLRWYAKTWH